MWIGGQLIQLVVLLLQGNKFQENIPTSMCHLSFLQTLDLYENNITGQIPKCFGQIVALSNSKFPRKILYHSSFTFGYEGNEKV